MTKFDKAYEEMAKWEGGYSDDKYDPGGKTIWGITERHHPETFGIIIDLLKTGNKALARLTAKNLYYRLYWNPLYDEIPDSSLAFKVFDFGVNAGVKRAVKILQKTINNLYGTKYLFVDGMFGQDTLKSILLIEQTNKDCKYSFTSIYNDYIKRLGRFYRSLGTFWRFGKGWMRRLRNRKYLD